MLILSFKYLHIFSAGLSCGDYGGKTIKQWYWLCSPIFTILLKSINLYRKFGISIINIWIPAFVPWLIFVASQSFHRSVINWAFVLICCQKIPRWSDCDARNDAIKYLSRYRWKKIPLYRTHVYSLKFIPLTAIIFVYTR